MGQKHFRDGILLQILMDNIPDTIYFKDKQSRFVKINKAQAKLLGVKTPEEAIGKTDYDFFSKKHADAALEDEKKILETKEPLIDKFERVRKWQGKELWLSSTKVPLISPSGEIQGTVGISRDVTDRKHLEDALKKSGEKYQRLSEELMNINIMKDMLLDVMTHDLKNPAGVIMELSKLLIEDPTDDEIVNTIYQASRNLIEVVETVTSLAKVGLGEKIHKQEIDIVKIIDDTVFEFHTILSYHQIQLDRELPATLPVHANKIICEVIKNYLSNAIKHGATGKKIIIKARKNEKYVSIKVIDFGHTIPEKMRKEIFKRHVQLDGNTHTGQGLGLAIVKRIAEAHDAKVGVEPNEPRGNQFYLQLPLN